MFTWHLNIQTYQFSLNCALSSTSSTVLPLTGLKERGSQFALQYDPLKYIFGWLLYKVFEAQQRNQFTLLTGSMDNELGG